MKKGDITGPVFPVSVKNTNDAVMDGFAGDKIAPGTISTYPGLSRREYFAAAALQGLLAYRERNLPQPIAQIAVKLADDIIAELDK